MIRAHFHHRIVLSGLGLCGMLVLFGSCSKGPSPPLSPAEALNAFVLADEDVEIQLVASEPMVQDPVAISFDEAGRLWVVEMLGFMADIDGVGERDPVGRVSVLFDDDGDGQMDRSTVFQDSLVLPRALAVVRGGLLIAEDIPLWFASDRDGDFRADALTLIDSTYGGTGMPEHSANGLWRGMDNWFYNAKSKFRYREIEGQWVRDTTEFRGQWGICHDDAGRLFYNYNWSQLHADLVPPNTLQANRHHTPTSGIDHGLTLDRTIFPIRSNTAVNRGYIPGTLDAEGRLLEFASACGPFVYRGNALPDAFCGNAFVCEPTGNLIKRNRVVETGFMLHAEGVYQEREFLASTDERFRPISLASGPDGALYVVDMYKGIIQHGPYMTDYLRKVTLERGLDKPVHMGRIWRITSKSKKREPIPDVSQATPDSLVALLESPNGWTRDTAQRLLVESGQGAIPELTDMVVQGNRFGQLHALWTLEGRGVKDPELFLLALRSQDPYVVQTALRLLADIPEKKESVLRNLTTFIEEGYKTAHPIVRMQMVLAAGALGESLSFKTNQTFLSDYGHLPVARDVVMSTLQDREYSFLRNVLAEADWQNGNQHREIMIEMLANGIANKGNTSELTGLVDMATKHHSNNQEWIQEPLLNGLLNARGSVEGGEIMLAEEPAWATLGKFADPLQAKLTWPGKPVPERTDKKDSIAIDPALYARGRQRYLNVCASCHGMNGEGLARFAPPLRNSEWVVGEDYKLAMILLHGMEGPVEVGGKMYDIPEILPNMPSFSTLQNEDIAAIATYIRNSWGHGSTAVSAGTVGRIRFRTQGQLKPWNAQELDTLQFEMDL